MGSMSDIYGRKLFFVLSLAGSCFGRFDASACVVTL